MVKRNRKAGFTLLELLITLSIVSIICAILYGFLNNSIKTNGKNETDIKALNIAQSEIENLRQQIKSKAGSSNLEIQLNNEQNIIISNDETNIRYEISNGSYEFYVDLKIFREYIGSRYLYKIIVTVNSQQEYFSKKVTTLTTQILSK